MKKNKLNRISANKSDIKLRRVLVLVETSRSFGRGIIQGITHYLDERSTDHHWTPWQISFQDRGLLEGVPTDLAEWNGDGIISRSSTIEMYNSLCAKHFPMVELLGDGSNFFAEVRVAENYTAKLAFQHLRRCGLTRFAFYAFGNNWWGIARCNAFKSVVEEAGFQCFLAPELSAPSSLETYTPWRQRLEKPLCEWINTLPRPIGIWTASDLQAMQVLQACYSLGIKVPEEIAVLGTGNDALVCNLMHPTLSSVDINAVRVGYEAAALLDEKMVISASGVLRRRYHQDSAVVINPTEVVSRQSTNMIAVNNPEIAMALHYIYANFKNDVSAEDVAQHVSISRSTLDRNFRKLFGYTPEKEICRLRMEFAQKLLRETNWSVGVIAEKVGFHRTEYFVRVFKTYSGYTPQRYRNMYLAQAHNE